MNERERGGGRERMNEREREGGERENEREREGGGESETENTLRMIHVFNILVH